MTMAVPMIVSMTVVVRMVMPMIVVMSVGLTGRGGVQVATHGPEVESFERNVNSSVIA